MFALWRPWILVVGLCVAHAAGAEVFTVGTGADCTHATLAEALDWAVFNGPGEDEIRLTQSLVTTNAAFTVSQTSVRILGGYSSCGAAQPSPGGQTVVQGDGESAVFRVSSGRHLELHQIRITGGGSRSWGWGGGILVDSAVAHLTDVEVSQNQAIMGGGLAVMGSNAVLVVESKPGVSRIHHNRAEYGGGIYVGDGAVLRLDSDGTQVTENLAMPPSGGSGYANSGGGIFARGTAAGAANSATVEVAPLDWDAYAGTRPLRGFLLAENSATGSGGGITLHGNAELRAEEMTVRDNLAGSSGGGIFTYGNTIGDGARVYLSRRHTWTPTPIPQCEGLYGCNRITGNEAAVGGGIFLMHSQARIAQVLIQGNRNLEGSGSAIGTGNINGVVPPANRIWLESAVIVGNSCYARVATNCATLNLSVGPNQLVLQHLTLADNELSGPSPITHYEIDTKGQSGSTGFIRSVQIEPQRAPALNLSVGMDADCIMAPTSYGTRPLVKPMPYRFMSRDQLDYRPAADSDAIDACDTDALLDGEFAGGPDLVPHGSVDDPTVPNRLGADAHADIGAFELTMLLSDGFE